ncbi:MAG: hypothetical protein Q8L60_08660 [Gammaproteobacteria bacterium]|nr:hypothetical protein [Gammaproteobacteria bacterium]MDP2140243.1 hypothetical protein [Gammaproteobacteria bacterium]MDP2348118.1 hypothetical protein [Gammaproteobacteria bacterium]
MYITRTTLLLLLFSYLLFLLSVDWMSQPDGAWYRPFIVGLLVIGVAAFCHREQSDDL